MITYKRFLTLSFIFLTAALLKVHAATVDTVLTHSTAMNKDIKAVVIRPDDYSASKKFPVLYLLHGFSGNYSDWILKVPSIKKLSDVYNMVIVCPDGGFASWYFDSPVSKEWQFETYISKELISYIDSHYSTITDRSGRAITGLSMGGHGALYLAFKHLDLFGAAGSMSGGVDLRPFSDSFGIEQVLGKYSLFPQRWEQNSVINMVYLLKPNSLAITFDCGSSDFLFGANKALHEKLLERNIPHDFTVRPGAHSWDYWGNSINYQALFFSRFFNKEK
ncbi:alpha/beta hydrolase family protein [Mucilaginibacter sp.]|uniref:alpha/beta hydrolase n=1 Tax=Mucilaginibacter sp. TaxID=1882438 RepID=UPI0028503C31|nr:alpha/beta hydrolase family protein [Mucilaginibacter sp.]MDR3693405.1 alpha/beta hydrolase family protein [Mucilaginibacter sp.]